MNVRIEASWREALAAEFDKLYFGILTDRIRSEYQSGHAIYPPAGQIFRALDLCPLDRVRVVILGQDPYHGAGQAEGLAFSVPHGIAVPPSLVNIKQEIADDLGRPSIITGGELLPWVEQGVLLLNTTLTVRSGEAASHQGLGWETFTDAVIQLVSQRCDHVVFLLWGSPARRKAAMIDATRHCILEAPHPSPLSAHRGFFGCRHFSRANAYLQQQGLAPIQW
ncbi:uracil-DNA glycosylase [Porphyromonas sp. oral taxon 275]|uniref:uracil-DNA glycosylase n=1 Tax=Porphyromonas sp. oral taxon 275 TaxID=712435 RepID=UPI001BAC15DF|nr:uracil-DNA glycosylase [Porphyromonas sp. oral taxon 275]QUB42705.1 uracil-DNA glycosylase [Porphyromonas sp. oral taxon 275]